MFKNFGCYDGFSFCGGLVFFAPVALLVRTQGGLTTEGFFLLQAFLSAVIFLGEIPAGMLTDRIGYRKTLILSQAAIFTARLLLLAAFLGKSPVLFALEALVEGISFCFTSGTGSAWLYEVYGGESYLPRLTRSGNFGTAGFILSTLAYVALYRRFGIPGLLAATALSSFAGFLFSLGLKQEPRREGRKRTSLAPRQLGRLLAKGKALIALSSVFSIAGMVISFFYAEKLLECGLDPQWMSPIILLYSLVGMLADPILRRLRSVPAGRIIAVFCALASGVLVLFTFLRQALPVTILMVILPLLLDIPGCCLAQEENVFVDRFSGGENRAAVLSALNMGVNLVEILALFASAALTGIGLKLCFLATAAALLLGGRAAGRCVTNPGRKPAHHDYAR